MNQTKDIHPTFISDNVHEREFENWHETLIKNLELNRKIDRELSKRSTLFSKEKIEEVRNQISYISKYISKNFEYDNLGLELTSRGSFIFTLIINNVTNLYIVYNSFTDDLDTELYFRVFENENEIDKGFGSIEFILDFVKNKFFSNRFTVVNKYNIKPIENPFTSSFNTNNVSTVALI